MNDTEYSVKPRDLNLGQKFKIQEDSKLETYYLNGKIIQNGPIMELPCIHVSTGLPKTIMYNSQYPRDIYVEKLSTAWREM